MITLDCYVGLNSTIALDKDVIKAWFACVRENAPEGVMCTAQTNDEKHGLKAVSLVARQQDGKIEYLIPLSRNLTEDEGEKIISNFSLPEGDFDVVMSSSYGELVPQADSISVDDAKYGELCTAWAKRQHDTWMADRLAGGWRYGPSVSVTQRTHPLLKSWSDLPSEHRGVDLQAPAKMIALLNDSGYAIISRDELRSILTLLQTR